ncbi:MAG: class I SAM-dependent rRNA methyltransferase [Ignavibacteriales bacterium]|nr:class I SAM-dependent rRNA methyltransferase [Ignavibacteriales bacterium]
MNKRIILRKNEEGRLLTGHQWVFSNELKAVEGNPEAGDVVSLHRHDGKFLGIGLYHPHSLICFRLLSREEEEVSFAFFERRLSRALELRRRLYPTSETFRLVHGEGDFLPGLIIDKYNEFLSIQTLSFGMDRRLTLICDALESLLHPKAIVERNESPLRTLEQLPLKKGVLRGTPDQTIISEHGVKFKIDLLTGQKTGIFLDQRENRKAVRRYVKGAMVLDCFCNEGGFSLNAIEGGAETVEGYDSSETAVAKAGVNATINHMDKVSFGVADIFDLLKAYSSGDKRYDVVILDPPSFARSKKTIATALKGYKEINGNALKIIKSGGFLVTASCSHHVSEEAFFQTIETAARSTGRTIQLLDSAGAGPDHPVVPAMPETRYLKFGIFAVH